MEALLDILNEVPQFGQLLAAVDGGGCPAAVSGLSAVHRAHFAAALGRRTGRPVVMLCADEGEAGRMARDLAALSGKPVLQLPGREFTFHNAATVSRQWEHRRLSVLRAMDGGAPFVVATAGPALESVLAARGAGADVYAREHGKWVLHLDIGGGTTNLARIDPQGKIVETGCLNVGGRLVKLDPQGTVTYVSPVLKGFPAPRVGERATPETLSPLLDRLVAVLEEAVGLSPPTALLLGQITDKTVKTDPMPEVLSFSGGVAALLEQEEPWLAYGDLGVLLAAKIRASRLMALPHILGRETIRATVVGAGSHATELSGSTVFYRGVAFPLQDLPVAAWTGQGLREPAAVALPGRVVTGYDSLIRLAEGLTRAASTLPPCAPLAVVLEQDVAKALGQALATLLPPERPILCLDSLSLPPESFLDVAAPVGGGTALPVVIKTLAFS